MQMDQLNTAIRKSIKHDRKQRTLQAGNDIEALLHAEDLFGASEILRQESLLNLITQ
jgi:hypothetical protein